MKKAIKNINFEIEGGTMTAFVGHSGAGKSTIMKFAYQDFMILNKEILKLIIKILKKFLKFFKKKYFFS